MGQWTKHLVIGGDDYVRGMRILVMGGTRLVGRHIAQTALDRGHDVTLFASGDSHTKANLEWVYETAPSERIGQTLPEIRHALLAYEQRDRFDVINDHAGMPSALIGGLLDRPFLHTVHGPLDSEGGEIYEWPEGFFDQNEKDLSRLAGWS